MSLTPKPPPGSTIAYRVMGAMVLNGGIYEGIEADRRATGQATAIVLAASAAAGIGSAGWMGFGLERLLSVAGIALIAWIAWALLVLQIGGRYLAQPQTRTDMGELLRTLGFSAAPGLLMALGVFPAVALPAFVLSGIWMLAAMVVAVQHALDFQSPWRALATCLVALCVPLALAVFATLWFVPPLQ
jgi:hypothetical protein